MAQQQYYPYGTGGRGYGNSNYISIPVYYILNPSSSSSSPSTTASSSSSLYYPYTHPSYSSTWGTFVSNVSGIRNGWKSLENQPKEPKLTNGWRMFEKPRKKKKESKKPEDPWKTISAPLQAQWPEGTSSGVSVGGCCADGHTCASKGKGKCAGSKRCGSRMRDPWGKVSK